MMGHIRRLLDPKGYRAALDAYWAAQTPREERIAFAWARRYGVSYY
jgi:hypothetical protein